VLDELGRVISSIKHWPDGAEIAGQNFTYSFDDVGNRTQTGGRDSAVSSYTVNELNQYTLRAVAGAVDVFGLADPQAAVQARQRGSSTPPPRRKPTRTPLFSLEPGASLPESPRPSGRSGAAQAAFPACRADVAGRIQAGEGRRVYSPKRAATSS